MGGLLISSLKWLPIVKYENVTDANELWNGVAYNADNSINNCPTSYGTLFAISYHTGYGMQFYSVSNRSTNIHVRTGNQNTWGDWILIT